MTARSGGPLWKTAFPKNNIFEEQKSEKHIQIRKSDISDPSLLSALGWVYGRSEGFPRTAYFIPGRDGMGVGAISEIVSSAPAAASSMTNTSKTPKSQRTKKSPLGLITEIRI